MSQQNRLLTDDARKWKPRNKQAAFIVRPAQEIFRAPPEKKFLPSEAEQFSCYKSELEEKAKQAKAVLDMHAAILETKRLKQKNKKHQKSAKCLWAKNELRAIHKRKNLPPPTWDEIRAYRKAKPIFGQLLHAQT